ncbi:PleD family two-component system response regulator [Aureimonas endophytica]|uniref:diguanylate cyclase n=1 Tax=Aureimonas endophytica TaxID=2027858 RepID=A0A917DZS3_9HYPH|nr:PleD family two-component system response regulator [Aureimonas endophytica]GGD88263.1 PleD family two-component system response regulator [Aureimonas endophytica]
MPGRILVVDDVEINRKLLEARLHAEYFEVQTAKGGVEALAACEAGGVDLVLLDVMMPEMDGYEVCRRLKASPQTRHIPIILVTALDLPSDKVKGLEAGADDFLTKPVRDLQLFSRVKSLLRLKFLTDELRIRADTTAALLGGDDFLGQIGQGGLKGNVLVVDETHEGAARTARLLATEHRCRTVAGAPSAEETGDVDLVVIALASGLHDPLRLCSQLRANEATRQIPILMIGDIADEQAIAKALELGANDYLMRPLDRNELSARVRTQIKRRRFDEGLRRSLRTTIELATSDALTGLQNRRFLDAHLPSVIERARSESRPTALLIADIDHFKRINDTYGHDAGDEVLKEFARRLRAGLRASDLACRLGGEEFVIVMPDTAAEAAAPIAERLRQTICERPFDLGKESLAVTVSIGLAVLEGMGDDAASLLKRADLSLYAAKRGGRNRVVSLAA